MKKKLGRMLGTCMVLAMVCTLLAPMPMVVQEVAATETPFDYTSDANYTLLTTENFEQYDLTANGTTVTQLYSADNVMTWEARVKSAMAIQDSTTSYGKVLDLTTTAGGWNSVARFVALQNDSTLAHKFANAKYVKFEYDVAMKSAINAGGSYMYAGVVANDANNAATNYDINRFVNTGAINQRSNNSSTDTGYDWEQNTWVTMTNYVDVENAKYNTKVNYGDLCGEYTIHSNPSTTVGEMTANQLLTLFFGGVYNATAPGEIWIDNIKVYVVETFDYTDDTKYTKIAEEDFEQYAVNTDTVKTLSRGGVQGWQARNNSAAAIQDSGSAHGKVMDLKSTASAWGNVVRFTALQNDSTLAQKFANAKYVKFEYDVAMKSALNAAGSFMHAGVVADKSGTATNYELNMFGSSGGINQRDNNSNKATGSTWTKDTWVTMTNYVDVANKKYNTRVNNGALSGTYTINSNPDTTVGEMTANQLLTLFFGVNYHATAPGEAWFDNVKVYIIEDTSAAFACTDSTIKDGAVNVATEAGSKATFSFNKQLGDLSGATVKLYKGEDEVTDITTSQAWTALTVTFDAALASNTDYRLELKNLKDINGTVLSDMVINFTTMMSENYTVQGVQYADGKATATVTVNADGQKFLLIVCEKADGILVDCKISAVTLNAGTDAQTITLDYTKTDAQNKVQVILWDGIEGIVPLCSSFTE